MSSPVEPGFVGVVSCDIVAHAAAALDVQRRRVEAINDIVRATLGTPGVTSFWASGGDGGHVLFTSAGWQPAATELIVRLWEWARAEHVPLRVTAHAGPLDSVSGADGGVQFVGETINCAGRLLELALPAGVVASDEFRAAVASAGAGSAGVVFHDPRWVQLRHLRGRLLFLLSVPPRVASAWPEGIDDDRAMLKEAVAARDGWGVLYRAKRLMQANAGDRSAERSVRQLTVSQLLSATPSSANGDREPNPFLGPLDGPSRVELLRVAQLVERRPNELICRSGDDGDMMFVLLSGEVGVVLPPSPAERAVAPTPPAVTLAPGDTMGELAFALRRPRTASLVATTEVALLGFTYQEVDVRLRNAPLAREALRRVDRFITERVLQHLYEQAVELIPAEPVVRPDDAEISRREALENAAACTSVLKLAPRASLSLEVLAADDPVERGGTYLLAGGSLRSASVEGKRADATAYSLLYVDVPGLVVTPDHRYTVEREAVVLHIGQPATLALSPDALNSYVDGLRRQARQCYFYDAFLSYAFHDAPLVERWEAEMVRQGLRVFRDELRVGHQFPDRLRAALADSLVLVAFVSANTMVRPPEENWVKREVELRERVFENGSPVIVPVILFGGDVEAIAGGHSPVDASGNEEAALASVIGAIRRIRAGEEPAPFGRTRPADHDGGPGGG